MNQSVFFYSLVELGVSIFLGVMLLYITFRILEKFVREKYKIELNNVAYSIFTSSVLFSVAFLVSGIKGPILNSLKLIQDQPGYDGVVVIDALKYTSLFLVVIVIAIALVNLISISLFTLMTKDVNEFEEIKNNNIAVSIITSVIIISISLLAKDSLYLLLESFVPYPEIRSFI
jgi:uncharacterized membrane protein YjfL (UPF0719 family)